MRRVLVALLTAMVGGAAILLATSGGSAHRVTVVTDRAEGIIPGLHVRAGGVRVGTVESATVTAEHRARLVLGLDDSVWPLPADSELELRFGGTIKYTDRYIELRRGDARGTVPEGGLLPASSFSAPAEYNSFFNTFDRSTRANLTATLDNGGPALRAAAKPFSAALRDAPPALAEIQQTFEELGGDPASLETLTRSASSVVDAIHRSQPGIGPLVSGAAETFDAVARESRAVRDTLAEAPATLAAARTLFARADGTLARVGRFSQDAGPGIARLGEVTSPLAQTLATVIRVAPDVRSALATARRAGPDLDRFLARLRSIMPTLGSVGSQAATQLACIRPYSPEIAGFFSTWGPGAFGSSDGRDTYLRAQLGFYPFPNALPFGVARLTELYPQVKTAFPRPPGDVAGQPWYQPRCGSGPAAYDPTSAGADG